MINTRKISRDIKDAEAKEFDLRQKLDGSINAIKDLKATNVGKYLVTDKDSLSFFYRKIVKCALKIF